MAPTSKNKGNVNQTRRKLFTYSPSKVALALEAIRGGMKVATASRNYNVPRTTLRHKISGRAPATSGHVGPQAVLGNDIENSLVRWIKECSRAGFPINKDGLLDSVTKIVTMGNIKTPFINNRPGRSWFESFMARHPDLSKKHAEYINKARAMITEEKIRKWFDEVTELLGPDGCETLKDPARVWNCDETSFFLAPKGGLILAAKGEHVYDTSKNSDKENITTLFTVNALGELAPPLTLYKYKRMNIEVVKNAPKGWSIGKTDKGWMTAESFYEYIGNVFLPYLKEKDVRFPIILFLDGHKSHLTLHLSTLCRDNGIIVVALVPNTTHMLQPLDVAVFFPLKQSWLKYIRKWRIDNEGQEITKFNLPTALNNILLNDPNFADNVKSGFNTCGLYPFSPDLCNYKRIITAPKNSEANASMRIVEMTHLQYLESKIQPNLVKDFNENYNNGLNWAGCTDALMLFNIWLDFKDDNNMFRNADVPVVITNELQSCLIPPSNEISISSTESAPINNIHYKLPIAGQSSLNETHKETVDIEAMSEDVMSTSKTKQIQMNAMDLVKSCVMWPEKKITNATRNIEYVPSVLTSDKWKDIKMAKDKEKEDKEELRNKRINIRKKKNIPSKKQSIESSESSEEGNLIDTSHSDCEDWIPQMKSLTFEELQRTPEEGDYVLVEFKNNKNSLYYVGKIICSKDMGNEIEISYLRKGKRGNHFVMPQVPDLASVAEGDIKMILPPPVFSGGTKRQNSFLSFAIDLSGLKLG